MPDKITFATPEAMAKTIKTKYPVYDKISDHDLVSKVLTKYPQYWNHVDRQSFERDGFKDVTTPAENSRQAVTPTTGAEIKAYNPTWWGKIKDVFGYSGVGGGVSAAKTTEQITHDKVAAFSQFVNHPIAAFEELFPNNPKTEVGRVAKGVAKAASGLTTPGNIGLAAVTGGSGAFPTALKAIGTAIAPSMAQGLYESGKRIHEARNAGDKEAEQEAMESSEPTSRCWWFRTSRDTSRNISAPAN